MSRKRDRRIAELTREHGEAVAEHALQERLAEQDNADLFVIDTAGARPGSKKQKTYVEVVTSNTVSKTEQFLLKKKLAEGVDAAGTKASATAAANELTDLWGDDAWVQVKGSKKSAAKKTASTAVAKKKNKTSTAKQQQQPAAVAVTRKVRAARPGQSYNPSVEDHQDAVTSALALEMQKAEKDAKLLALPASSEVGAVQETDKAGDESGSEEEGGGHADGEEHSGDRSGEEGEGRSGKSSRKQEKMTRAQRNKQRARNVAKYQEELERAEKLKIRQAGNVAAIAKEVRREEERIRTEKKQLREKKQATMEENLYAMTYAEAGTVPLSDELSGSMRQIIPKGVALAERENEMRKHGDLSVRDRRNRRAYEKPHASERVVWVPKYKTHEFDK